MTDRKEDSVPTYTFTNLSDYIQNVRRTESVPESLNANSLLFLSICELFTASGNMMDQMKKHMFYGTAIDNEQKFPKSIQELLDEVHVAADKLQQICSSTEDLNDLQKDYTITSPNNVRVFHSTLGISTEAVELVERLLSSNDDMVNLVEELGDVAYYLGIGADVIGNAIGKSDPLEFVLEKEINKLRLRFPDKFTQDSAENRDLEEERAFLSQDIDS